MTNVKEHITSLLESEQYKDQFNNRKQKYSSIAKYVPAFYEQIVRENHPWFCHGLALRMATYPPTREPIFQRLNYLLKMAENLEGWSNESENIGMIWAEDYGQFFHNLWMLQCVEYFIDRGDRVVFPGRQGKKSPDLKIITTNQDELYIECYVFSKWWFVEVFIEDIIGLIDPNLSLERTYNIKLDGARECLHVILEEIWEITEKSEIEKAKRIAYKKSPYIMYNNKGIKVLMEGEGEYQPDPQNAHGDPSNSAGIYLDEIIRNKENKNDLSTHHPNCLMVNGLGVDFQRIFFSDRVGYLSFESNNIDALKIHACGIDKKLEECSYALSVPSR